MLCEILTVWWTCLDSPSKQSASKHCPLQLHLACWARTILSWLLAPSPLKHTSHKACPPLPCPSPGTTEAATHTTPLAAVAAVPVIGVTRTTDTPMPTAPALGATTTTGGIVEHRTTVRINTDLACHCSINSLLYG